MVIVLLERRNACLHVQGKPFPRSRRIAFRVHWRSRMGEQPMVWHTALMSLARGKAVHARIGIFLCLINQRLNSPPPLA